MKKGKAVAIANEIRHGIHRRKYTERLPPDRQLAQDFGVDPKTIALAMSHLEGEGLVTRQRRVGTLIRPPDEVAATVRTGTAVLLMRTRGHLFGALSGVLAEMLQSHGYCPVLMSSEELDDASIQPLLERVRELRPEVFLVETSRRDFPIEALREALPAHVRLVRLGDRSVMQGNPYRIEFDAKAGALAATRHLLALGRRRVLLLDALFELPPHLYPETGHYDFNMGYRRALDEAGLAGHERFFFESHDEAETSDRLRDLMRGDERPDGILAFGDFRLVRTLNVLRELGLRVPEDVAMVGYFNTPWSLATHPPLSSIDVDMRGVAEALLHVATADAPSKVQKIAPRLVIRESAPAVPEGMAPR